MNEVDLVQLKSVPKELSYYPGRLVITFDTGASKIYKVKVTMFFCMESKSFFYVNSTCLKVIC